jgi:hypothetical protein
MQSRYGDGGETSRERLAGSRLLPARHETQGERVREIRRRIADDAYRCTEVAEEIARRILRSREL